MAIFASDSLSTVVYSGTSALLPNNILHTGLLLVIEYSYTVVLFLLFW